MAPKRKATQKPPKVNKMDLIIAKGKANLASRSHGMLPAVRRKPVENEVFFEDVIDITKKSQEVVVPSNIPVKTISRRSKIDDLIVLQEKVKPVAIKAKIVTARAKASLLKTALANLKESRKASTEVYPERLSDSDDLSGSDSDDSSSSDSDDSDDSSSSSSSSDSDSSSDSSSDSDSESDDDFIEVTSTSDEAKTVTFTVPISDRLSKKAIYLTDLPISEKRNKRSLIGKHMPAHDHSQASRAKKQKTSC